MPVRDVEHGVSFWAERHPTLRASSNLPTRGSDAAGDSILSGFGTVFAFRLYDQASRDFVRDRFGHNHKVVRYDSAVRQRGVTEDRVEGSVIEDWDISSLGVGQSILALPDGAPYRFTFAAPAPSVEAAA